MGSKLMKTPSCMRYRVMSTTKLISTRLAVCATCGHDSRLVVLTSEEVISRCYACGDVTRTPQPEAPVWLTVTGRAGQCRTAGDGAAPPELEAPGTQPPRGPAGVPTLP